MRDPADVMDVDARAEPVAADPVVLIVEGNRMSRFSSPFLRLLI